ncbi:hypothetical protein KW805_04820 [Candidatus Pacearchaeota archaeon]|nr:hypothetical protein [Candidatus Pacearchaeota archaeon]
MRTNIIVGIEIILLISMSFAISYTLHAEDSVAYDYNQSPKDLAFKIINHLFGKGIVSALDSSDLKNGVSTCLLSKNNKVCQEYPSSECGGKCTTACIPSSKSQVSACSVGTCVDPVEGICQPGSPKSACENDGGQWYNDPNGNIAQCKLGCCLLGDQASFITSQQCSRKSVLLGVTSNFKPEIGSEIECLALAKTQEEGACVYEQDFQKSCTFTTKASCLQKTGRADSFYPGLLCSNPALNTTCKKQARTACVEGKDEIYWFDSCGNRENIYDANKAQSWNEGKVLAKQDSCTLDAGKNLLAHQSSCGNCNYFLGSICGQKAGNQKLSDSSQNVVCKDLSCTDAQGKKRKNGESWCAYQGSIGVDEKNNRATDTPGSSHYREVCIDGVIQTEACADARREVCIESQTQTNYGKISSAACRANLWTQCSEYNTEVTGEGNARIASEKQRDNKCSQNPDCFVKKVDISDNFKFNLCAPRYPPGFDLSANSDSAEMVCGLASQTCTAIYVKKLFSGWKCEANCECEDAIFTEKMNDLCISLGDCGAKVNYNGQYRKNYQAYNAEKVPDSYIEGLKKYSATVTGQFADAGSYKQFYTSLGIPSDLGAAGKLKDQNEAALKAALVTSGSAGILVLAAYHAGIASSFGAGGAAIISKIPILSSLVGKSAGVSSAVADPTGEFGVAANPSIAAYGGAVAGASLGLAVTSLLIKFTGIGPGLDPYVTNSLLVAGAYSGAIIGANIGSGGTGIFGGLGASGSASLAFAWVIGVAIVLAIVIFKLLGIGKTKEVKVEFQCQPWQAPTGGKACKQCGKDGFPCTPYACHSLGQTCEFVNEGSGQEACIDNNPNDASPPVIHPLKKVLAEGYSYQDENENGVKLVGPEECIKAYTPVTFGVGLDEPGQCKYDVEHTQSYDDMEFYVGDRNLYIRNHSMAFTLPSLESLGLPGYEPSRKANYNMYIRCEDTNGNKNEKEYAINFCVKPGEDLTPPSISPGDYNEYVAYNATSVVASIYTSEPAECKWDTNDKEYDAMAYSWVCDSGFENQTFLGWKCSATLPINNDSTFSVRCSDQPWLNASTKRNENHESYPLTFKKSKIPLTITSLTPDNSTIIAGTDAVSVEVVAKVSGGADGTAKCSYKIDNYYVDFLDTLKSESRNVFNQFTPGAKVLAVKCEDRAGNRAERTARFSIELDSAAPEVTRVYEKSGSLVVITNEPARCSFVHFLNRTRDTCSFQFPEGEVLEGSDLIHTAPLEQLPYYIKCKDRFENIAGACSMIVQAKV